MQIYTIITLIIESILVAKKHSLNIYMHVLRVKNKIVRFCFKLHNSIHINYGVWHFKNNYFHLDKLEFLN